MRREEASTYLATIFVGGNIDDAKRLCGAHCMDIGLCVTVDPTEFIYTGGRELGVRVGLINYPRFPAASADTFAKAEALALVLIDGLAQHSASIVATDKTVWLSRRESA